MSFASKILSLTKKLYPTGRAFRMSDGGVIDKIHKGLAVSENQAFSDALSVLNSILPDNDNFTTDDAAIWEIRLGLISDTSVSLTDRKAAILRKMNHPGNIPARQHYLYIERSLRLANFDVWVHENIAGISPQEYIVEGDDVAVYGDIEYGDTEYGDISESILSPVQYGDVQYGDTEYGYGYNNIVANHIDKTLDAGFNTGENFRAAFFIGGQVFGTFASVPANRELEFRQLILTLKPANTIAFIFINYT